MHYKYCPVCSRELVKQERFGHLHSVCPDNECGFVLFLDPKVVAVAIVEQDGKLLLGKRNINPGKGLWNFPGGYMDRGERVEDAILREVKEETNLDIILTGLLGVYSSTGVDQIVIVYRAVPTANSPTMQPQVSEVTELAFFSPDELPPMAFATESQMLADWKAVQAKSS